LRGTIIFLVTPERDTHPRPSSTHPLQYRHHPPEYTILVVDEMPYLVTFALMPGQHLQSILHIFRQRSMPCSRSTSSEHFAHLQAEVDVLFNVSTTIHFKQVLRYLKQTLNLITYTASPRHLGHHAEQVRLYKQCVALYRCRLLIESMSPGTTTAPKEVKRGTGSYIKLIEGMQRSIGPIDQWGTKTSEEIRVAFCSVPGVYRLKYTNWSILRA
jgi:hypothetical protein